MCNETQRLLLKLNPPTSAGIPWCRAGILQGRKLWLCYYMRMMEARITSILIRATNYCYGHVMCEQADVGML